MTKTLTQRDWEALSAYLDDQLEPRERARLEARLSAEPALQAGLRELNQTRAVLRKLPSVRAPRNFTLSPEMAPRRPFLFRFYPVFQSAAVVATVLFALVFTLQYAGFVSITRGFDSGFIAAQPAMEAEPGDLEKFEPSVEMFAAEETQEDSAGAVEDMTEKSFSAAEEPLENGELVPEEAEEPALEFDSAPAESGSRMTAAATELMEEAEGNKVPPAPEILGEAPLEPGQTPTPTATLKPSPTPALTATPAPTPAPLTTPTFTEVLQQDPISIPVWAVWVLGGVAVWAAALTIFLRSRQS